MKKFLARCVTALALVACGLGSAWAQIQLVGITEVRGAGQPAATSFKNGYLMAIDEINAAGGVLGQKLQLTQIDIDTNPDAAVEAAKKAVAAKPFAILGPVFSGLTAATLPHTNGIAHFTGGEAASLTRQFHPTLLRTALSQAGSAPRLAGLISYGLNLHKIALVSIDNEFGRSGRTEILAALKRRNTQPAYEVTVQQAQKDFSKEVAALKSKDFEALLLYVNENEAIELLRELKKQGFAKPIVSDGLIAATKVLTQAGDAMDGVLVHINRSADAPRPAIQAFAARYLARYGVKADHNSIKGYFAAQIIKAGVEQQGKVDPAGFVNTVKNTRFDNQRFPELLSPVSFDLFGDINHESYYAVLDGGQVRIVASIRSTEGGQVELPGGRLITLNSNEFRRELSAALNGTPPASPAPAPKPGAK